MFILGWVISRHSQGIKEEGMLSKGYTLHGQFLTVFQAVIAVLALAVLSVHHFSVASAAAPDTVAVWLADGKLL